VRKLGQGGMGAVYLAQHTLMDEPRALKFLSAELSQDQAFTARFLREVRTLRQIRHPNVVDCGDLESAEDGSLFFSMEFVDGPDLRAFLNSVKGTGFSPYIEANMSDGVLTPEGTLPVELALQITRQIAAGLAAAHARGMVHRDIKPENILLARDGSGWQPKIADFGIVATKESSSVFTRTGGTLLTVAYAAPEQWRGTAAAELDGRTDLYALGGLLYEMLTGQTAFHAESYEGWAHQHQVTPPPPPSALRPELANWQGLDVLVQRLLAKDREDRPKDVAEFLGMLDAVQYLLDARMETIKEKSNHFHGRDLFGKRYMRSSRWAFFGLIIGVVFMIAFVVWSIATHQSGKPTDVTVQTQPAVQPQKTTNEDTFHVPKGLMPFPPGYVSKGIIIDPQNNKTTNDANGRDLNLPKSQADHVFESMGLQPTIDSVTLFELSGQEPVIIKTEQKAEALLDKNRFAEAAPLFAKTCDAGMARGCSDLAYLYNRGTGVEHDGLKAGGLSLKACFAGDTYGCNEMGEIYEFGDEVHPDSAEAAIYFARSRKIYSLGCTFGIKDDCVEAEKIMHMAQPQYDPNSAVEPAVERQRIYIKAREAGLTKEQALQKVHEFNVGLERIAN
jgi:serine/threonine protein kinase